MSPVSTPTGDELKEAFNNQVMCLGNVFDDCKNTGKYDHFSVKITVFESKSFFPSDKYFRLIRYSVSISKLSYSDQIIWY